MIRPRNPRRATLPGLPQLPLWALFLLTVCTNAAVADAPRAVPAKGLSAYIEYDGLDTHADAWQATAAYAMLEKTPAGKLTAEVARQVADRYLKGVLGPKLVGADLLALQRDVIGSGVSIGFYYDETPSASFVAVFRGLGRKESRERVGVATRLAARLRTKTAVELFETTQVRGRDVNRVNDLVAAKPEGDEPGQAAPLDLALVWWFEGDDVIVVSGPTTTDSSLPRRVREVMDTVEGEASSVAIHPARAAAVVEGKEIQRFEPNGLFFVEASEFRGLFDSVAKVITDANEPLKAVELPAGKYMRDDIQYFPSGPDVPGAATQAATQRARLKALEAESPPPGEEKPVAAFEASASAAPRRDPEVAKTAMVPARSPEVKNKKTKKTKADFSLSKTMGLNGITRVVGRWGFQGKALLTDVRVEAPAPRSGLLALLDQTVFSKSKLPPIPHDSGAFLVGSCDPVKAYEAGLAMFLGDIAPGMQADDVSHIVDLGVFQMTGQRLREDILGHFGPTWCLYAEPRRDDKKSDRRMPTLMVEVDDAKAFGKVLDALVKRANAFLRAAQKDDEGKVVDGRPSFALEALPKPDRGYRLISPAGIISWLGEGQQPTILIGASYIAVAVSPAQARAALEAVSRPRETWEPSGEVRNTFDCLPEGLTSLTVGDPRDSSWPETLVVLPKLVQHIASAFEVVENDHPKATVGSKVLGMLGVPQAGGLRLQIDPASVPKADALQAQLFPSVLATAIDDRGVRFICREAFPLACVAPELHWSASDKQGEMIALRLRPFLFPCFEAEVAHNPKEIDKGLRKLHVNFRVRGSVAANEESND